MSFAEETFARCAGCGRVRWATAAAVKSFGFHCPKCGDRRIKSVIRLRWWERPRVAWWYVWEHVQRNPEWRWYLHPLSVAWGYLLGLTLHAERDAHA